MTDDIHGCGRTCATCHAVLADGPQPAATYARVDADEYEKRIREKVCTILTNGEWVYLVGLFQMAREHDDAATATPQDEERVARALHKAFPGREESLVSYTPLMMLLARIAIKAMHGDAQAATPTQPSCEDCDNRGCELFGCPLTPATPQEPVAWMATAGACTNNKSMADIWRDQCGQEITPLYLGAAQRSLDRETILKAIIEAQDCGLGDTGPDGKWRRIACNDKSLEGDRNFYHEDCDCSRAADAVLALSSTNCAGGK